MRLSTYLTLGLIAAVLMIGIGIGYYLTPEYKLSMYEKGGMSLGEADRTFDLRYVNAMIAHHRGAILLAEQAEKNSNREEIVSLSKEIQTNEPKLIAELYAWKKNWYGDTRKVKDPNVANLGFSGANFDQRFLNALIAHHKAGIVMTKEASDKSSRTEVLDNANAVESFLSSTLVSLEKMRKDWYNI